MYHSSRCHSLTRQLGGGLCRFATVGAAARNVSTIPANACRTFCTSALSFLLVIRLRANWAAVRQSVRAPLPVIPASEPGSWAAFCGVLHCATASPVFILALASQGSLTRQLGGGSAIRASTSSRHSGLRAGILGGLLRGIALRHCLAGVHPRLRLASGFRVKPGMTAEKGRANENPQKTALPAGNVFPRGEPVI